MNIGIAGAGLIGRLMAWQLLRKGHQVCLFDADSVDGHASAARVAAAMLAPFSEVVSCEREIFDWGMRALTLWPTWIDQLTVDSEKETVFQRRGSVVIAHSQDQNELSHFNRLLQSKVSDYPSSIDSLNKDQLQDLEPALIPTFAEGIHLRDEGCVDNWQLLDNLATAIIAMGGQWQSGVSVDQVGSGVIETQANQHCFDWVIDSRGLGAKSQLADLRGVRGEVLMVSAPEVSLSRPVRLMHPRYQLYIVPKPGNRYVIGATEIESESLAPITVRSSLELQSALYSVHTGFAEANIIHAFANCRPAFMNNLPRVEWQQGLMTINGLYRHGYLLGPVVVQAALNTFDKVYDSELVYRK
jgi:glycine oxidase